ncbi:MAG: DUF1223 domain-containing protein [Pseudomonadota bacterium]
MLELFTSEHCPACPPADKALEKLSEQNHIIALGCHVTYFSRQSDLGRGVCSQRQFNFAQQLKQSSPFTPQFIINGQHSAVGTNQSIISAALLKGGADKVQLINIQKKAPQVFSYSLPFIEKNSSDLWLALYKKPQKAGRRNFIHVVDVILTLGSWDGSIKEEIISPAVRSDHQGFAIFAQNKKTGKITAAGQYSL